MLPSPWQYALYKSIYRPGDIQTFKSRVVFETLMWHQLGIIDNFALLLIILLMEKVS